MNSPLRGLRREDLRDPRRPVRAASRRLAREVRLVVEQEAERLRRARARPRARSAPRPWNVRDRPGSHRADQQRGPRAVHRDRGRRRADRKPIHGSRPGCSATRRGRGGPPRVAASGPVAGAIMPGVSGPARRDLSLIRAQAAREVAGASGLLRSAGTEPAPRCGVSPDSPPDTLHSVSSEAGTPSASAVAARRAGLHVARAAHEPQASRKGGGERTNGEAQRANRTCGDSFLWRLRRWHPAHRHQVHRIDRARRQRPLHAARLPRRDPRPRRHARGRLGLPDPLLRDRRAHARRPARRARRVQSRRAARQHRRRAPRRHGDHQQRRVQQEVAAARGLRAGRGSARSSCATASSWSRSRSPR